jgi:hypothetical protein
MATWFNLWIEIIEMKNLKKEDILQTIKRIQSKSANNIQEKVENKFIRYQYELTEYDRSRKVSEYIAIYSFTIQNDSYLQCAAYCDTNKSIELANRIIQSIYG